MKEYMFFARMEDAAPIKNYIDEFLNFTPSQLIAAYNETVDLGFVGSREQARRVIALHNAMKKVLGSSPITIVNNSVIVLGEKIDSSNQQIK